MENKITKTDEEKAEAWVAENLTQNTHSWHLERAFLAGMTEARKSLWISVKEMLPESGVRQLCIVKSSDRKYPLVWGWMGDNWTINISDPNLGSHKNITHWLPLPTAPDLTEDKNDNR